MASKIAFSILLGDDAIRYASIERNGNSMAGRESIG
jgi:hypothetical protein